MSTVTRYAKYRLEWLAETSPHANPEGTLLLIWTGNFPPLRLVRMEILVVSSMHARGYRV